MAQIAGRALLPCGKGESAGDEAGSDDCYGEQESREGKEDRFNAGVEDVRKGFVDAIGGEPDDAGYDAESADGEECCSDD